MNYQLKKLTAVTTYSSIYDENDLFQAMQERAINIRPNDNLTQTLPDAYFFLTGRNGSLQDVVSVIFPCALVPLPQRRCRLSTKLCCDGQVGKKTWFGSLIWRCKIIAWNAPAENLNVKTNRTYRFTKYKLKPSVSKTV